MRPHPDWPHPGAAIASSMHAYSLLLGLTYLDGMNRERRAATFEMDQTTTTKELQCTESEMQYPQD